VPSTHLFRDLNHHYRQPRNKCAAPYSLQRGHPWVLLVSSRFSPAALGNSPNPHTLKEAPSPTPLPLLFFTLSPHSINASAPRPFPSDIPINSGRRDAWHEVGVSGPWLIRTHHACPGEQQAAEIPAGRGQAPCPPWPVPLEHAACPRVRFNCILRGRNAPASRAVPPGPFLVQQGKSQDPLRATCTPPSCWLHLD